MVKSLAVCDKECSIEYLKMLINRLPLSNIISTEACTNELTRDYTVLFFVLNAENIGNMFFIQRIKEILKYRKSKKSIYFLIDGIERLEREEIFKVKIELERTLKQDILHPQIFPVSLALACAYSQYHLGVWTLEYIQKDKGLFILDTSGYSITGKALEVSHIESFLEQSRVDKIIAIFKEELPKFQHIDIERSAWGVIGSGKTTFKSVVEYIEPHLNIVELETIEDTSQHILDGIIVLLDLNHEYNKELLITLSQYQVKLKRVVLLNKIDNYMSINQTREEIEHMVNGYTSQLINEKVLSSISSYYASKVIAMEKGEIAVEEVWQDKEVVLLDHYGFPVVQLTKEKFKQIFINQSSLDKIQGVCKEICSNHS